MLADFLPGQISIERGNPKDYVALARFHYVAGRPGTWAGVWVARYIENRDKGQDGKGQGVEEDGRVEGGNAKNQKGNKPQAELSFPRPLPPRPLSLSSYRVVAIAVLSWPPLGSKGREKILRLNRYPMKRRAKWLNENVRSISRVVVHPQFRGVGLASELVRRILRECPTRYVETIAAMGKVHPFFEKAGMKRIEHEGEKAYFIFDRKRKAE